jgi:hypothetical protein
MFPIGYLPQRVNDFGFVEDTTRASKFDKIICEQITGFRG